MKKIKTKKSQLINENSLLVTIDGGKDTHFGYYRCPDGTDTKPFEFLNNRDGFNEFWEQVMSIYRTQTLEKIVVGFESTGPYLEPLTHFLNNKKGVKLVQVNPMHTKRVKELQGNSPNKTDRKDPKVIADIIELGHALSVVIPKGPAAELRRLTQARERTIEKRTALFNQLQTLLALIFPEFMRVMKDVKIVSAQYLLNHFPTPQNIVKLGLPALTSILRKISRGKLKADRAKALFEAAQTSVGVQEGQSSILLEIKGILSTIEAYQGFILEYEKEMSTFLEQIPYIRSILSLKGIGEVTAAGLIGEVGDFRNFSTISEVLKLAGLNLYELSSGKHKGKLRISKRGRPLLRKLLYFTALNTVRKGGVMHHKYQEYLDRGMLKNKALIAIARKLIGIIFALVRDHSIYQEHYLNTSYRYQEAA
jgi:transposase